MKKKRIIQCFCGGTREVEIEICEECGSIERTGEYKGRQICQDCYYNSLTREEISKL
jgi:hypothetical protein